MTRERSAVIRVESAVRDSLAAVRRPLLAVSGGRDSMALLDAATRCSLNRDLIVATFDHGTGRAATAAATLVVREAGRRGLRCVTDRASRKLRGEAAWRDARWSFLRAAAAREDAVVATAHTLDDQIETVAIRVLREAGPRGLAGLFARSEIVRPLLEVWRSDVAAYAAERGVPYVDDPSNESRAHLRNRVRLDLLPALEAARSGFSGALLAISRDAAGWRERLDRILDELGTERLNDHTIRIASESLAGYDAAALRVLWPAIAARARVTLDRRGTERAAAFTIDVLQGGRQGRVIQLSGGGEIESVRGGFVLRGRSGH